MVLSRIDLSRLICQQREGMRVPETQDCGAEAALFTPPTPPPCQDTEGDGIQGKADPLRRKGGAAPVLSRHRQRQVHTYDERVWISHKKEKNNAICSNMGRIRDSQPK